MGELMDKQQCGGCEDNFYNGNNPHNVKECWCFKNAKLVMRKQVSIHQRPPWRQKAHPVPSCYKQKGYVFVDENQVC